MHCWNILKDEEKWKAKRREMAELKQAPRKKQKVRPDSTPTMYKSTSMKMSQRLHPQSPKPQRGHKDRRRQKML
jgi:hypothetical protein